MIRVKIILGFVGRSLQYSSETMRFYNRFEYSVLLRYQLITNPTAVCFYYGPVYNVALNSFLVLSLKILAGGTAEVLNRGNPPCKGTPFLLGFL